VIPNYFGITAAQEKTKKTEKITIINKKLTKCQNKYVKINLQGAPQWHMTNILSTFKHQRVSSVSERVEA